MAVNSQYIYMMEITYLPKTTHSSHIYTIDILVSFPAVHAFDHTKVMKLAKKRTLIKY